MSDLLMKALECVDGREPLQHSFSDAAHSIGLDGMQFIEYATSKPQALGQVFEMMGLSP